MPSPRRDIDVWVKSTGQVDAFRDTTGDRLFVRIAENSVGEVVRVFANHSNPKWPQDHVILEIPNSNSLILGRAHGLYPVGINIRPDNNFDVFWLESGTRVHKTVVDGGLIKRQPDSFIDIPNTSKGIIDVEGSNFILTNAREAINVQGIVLADAMIRGHLTVGVLGNNNWVILYNSNLNRFYVLDDSGQNQLHPRLAVGTDGSWKVGISYGPGIITNTVLREYITDNTPSPVNDNELAIKKLNSAIQLINEVKGLLG